MIHHPGDFLPALVGLGDYIYIIIAIALFFEGEAVIYAAMFLAFQDLISIYILVPVIFASVIATDFSSYQIGRHGHKFFPRLARFYGNLTAPMDERLHSLSLGVYLVSKFTYGFHRAVLIRSGMIGIPFKKLFAINFVTSTIWIAAISGIAFASWKSLGYVKRSFHYIEITLLIGIICVLLGSHIISHFAKIKLLGDAEKHRK